MILPCYLAMTVKEIEACPPANGKIGWMTGLSALGHRELPALPAGSLLILNDSEPFAAPDPEAAAEEITELMAQFACEALLLDLQREPDAASLALVRALCALPCKLILSAPYAQPGKPVFLPPVPLTLPLQDYLQPWQGREIWLDTTRDAANYIVTETDSTAVPLPPGYCPDAGLADPALHCHYRVDPRPGKITFTLYRTEEDLRQLLAEAAHCGVAAGVGLWQELREIPLSV